MPRTPQQIGQNRLFPRNFRHFRRWWRPAWILLLCLAATPVTATPAHAMPARCDLSQAGMRLTCPAEFEVVPPPSPTIVLVLRHVETGFPTLNIMVTPGPFPGPPSRPEMRATEMLDSYRAAGLTTTRLIESAPTAINGRAAVAASFAYESGRESFRTKVIEFTTPARRVTVTWSDTAAGYETNLPLLTPVLNSLTLTDGEADLPRRDGGALEVSTPLVVILGLLLGGWLLLTLGWRARARRRPNP